MVEKEDLAVKCTIGMLNSYKAHNPFQLLIDHAPLQWTVKMKDHNAKGLQLYLSLLLSPLQLSTSLAAITVV